MPQDHAAAFEEPVTVFDWMRARGKPRDDDQAIRATLGRLLFSRDEMPKTVDKLSGGERGRMLFGEIMLQRPNIIVMDEPTNHLDMESIEALNLALENYPGTLDLREPRPRVRVVARNARSSRSTRRASSTSAAATTTTCAAAASRSICSAPRASKTMPQPDGQAPEDPAGLVAGLARAHITARCLHVIAECGAADAIGPDGATPAELAGHTGLAADALDRMLRLLAAHGIFKHGTGGRYEHSAASRLLCSDDPALCGRTCG